MGERGARPAVARVMGPDGEPVGAAFLVTPTVLLTAAHVVSVAAGDGKDGVEQPAGEVFLSFVVAPDQYLRAEVVHWVPPGGASPEDIAGLRLVDPAPEAVAPVPFTDLTAPLGRRVVTLGFPRDAPNGGWGLGRLADADTRDLVQVDTLPDSQFTIEEGFSGTPVWDVEDRAVAGLVVEGWTRGRRSGFMIPTSVLLDSWPWLAERVRPASPFRGLRSFTEHDSDVFFGRDELVARIERLTRTAPVLNVVGPSGIGKSSLVNAGVLPRLRQRAGLVIATARPSQARTPLRAIALALARVAGPDADPLRRGALVDDFADRLARGLVAEVVEDVLDGRGERLLLVVDQFEEVFIASESELAQVTDVLRYCLRPHSRLDLLTALRVDFLGRALRHRDLAELVQDTRLVTVGELSQSELRTAIVAPVRGTRMARYEPGLVDRLLTDVGAAPGGLPLLQFTLAMLWDKQDHGVLTHRAYDELGGITSALAGHAEAIWDGLGPAERASATRLLVQLLFPVTDSTGFVRRVALRSQLDDAQWAAAQRLSTDRARLVVVREQDDGGQAAELAHDALVTHWPRLGELGEHDREFREWQEVLRQRIRRNAAPLAGADLRDALRWQARRGVDLAPAETSYVDKSRRLRAKRLRRWGAAAMAVVLVAWLVLSQREQEVDSGAADALLKDILLETDKYGSLRTALRAYRTAATFTSRARLESDYEQYQRVDQVLPDYTAETIKIGDADPIRPEPSSATAQKISADGRTLVTTDPETNLTVWRVNGQQVTGRPLDQTASRVTVSRDGRYVAYLQSGVPTGRLDGPGTSCDAPAMGYCVNVYDTVTRKTREFATITAALFSQVPIIRFDPTGQVLGALFGDVDKPLNQRLTTWQVATGRQRDNVLLLGGTMLAANDFWFAPGGSRFLLDVSVPLHPTSRLSKSVLVSVDLTGPAPVFAELAEHVVEAAVSGDGGLVATRVSSLPENPDEDTVEKLVVWDVATARPVTEVPEPPKTLSIAEIGLDRHGDRVFVTYPHESARRVSVWRVDRTDEGPVFLHLERWQNVVPLGSDENAALLLVYDNVVGLVLPAPGEPPPMRRFAKPVEEATGDHHDAWADEINAKLVIDVAVPGELRDLPAGAYAGPLGG